LRLQPRQEWTGTRAGRLRFDGGDGCTFDRREQHAAKGVAMVVPNPRSKGCAQKIPYLSVKVEVSTARRFGSENLSKALRVLLFGHLAQPSIPEPGPIPVKRLEKADLARK